MRFRGLWSGSHRRTLPYRTGFRMATWLPSHSRGSEYGTPIRWLGQLYLRELLPSIGTYLLDTRPARQPWLACHPASLSLFAKSLPLVCVSAVTSWAVYAVECVTVTYFMLFSFRNSFSSLSGTDYFLSARHVKDCVRLVWLMSQRLYGLTRRHHELFQFAMVGFSLHIRHNRQ